MINAKTLADILRSPLKAEAAKKAVESYLDDVKNAFHEFTWKNPCIEIKGDAIALEIHYVSEKHSIIEKRNIFFVPHADDNGHLISYIGAKDNGDFDWSEYTDSAEFLDLVCNELYKRGFSVQIDTRENVIVPLILFDVDYAERSITAEGITAVTLAEVLSEPRRAEAAKKLAETYLEATEAEFKSAVESNPNLPCEVDAVAVVIRYVSSEENGIKRNGVLGFDHQHLRMFIQNNYMWKDVKMGNNKIDWRVFSDSEFYLHQVMTALEEKGFEIWFDEPNRRIVPLVFVSRDYSDVISTD